MGKITKKYIGTDQVGSVQLELENNSSLRSKNASSVSTDLIKLDAANLLQILQQPYLPGNASAALQAVPKQQLDSAVSTISSDITALQNEDLTFLKLDGTRSMTGALNMGTHKITNLVDPTSAQDAATKAYVDAQITANTVFHKQAIPLSATDITNQYVDLTVKAIAQSCIIFVGERVALFEGLDYSVSVVGSVSRITLIPGGPSSAGGAEALVEGQTLYIQCVID